MAKSKRILGQLDMMAALDSTPLSDSIITPRDTLRFNEFIKDWKNSTFFGLDIETAGTTSFGDGLNPFKGRIRLIQIGLAGKDDVLIVDMFEDVPQVFLDTLKATCESKTQHQIGAFIQFDLSWLQYQLGIHSNCPYDIRILSILYWCGIKYYKGKRILHSLKEIAYRLFGTKVDKSQQVSDWSQPELSNTQLNYAAEDVRLTLNCFKKLAFNLQRLDKEVNLDLLGKPCQNSLMEIAKIECFSIPVFVEIYLTGQPVDLAAAETVRKQYVEAIESIYKPVQDKLDLPFSASRDKLCLAIWESYNILLTEEVKPQDQEEKDETLEFKQLALFGVQLPNLPPNTKLSTASANLFLHYTETNNEALLRISLCRSLKKCVDSLDALVASAKSNNDGYARGRYTSLGSTGSGRSTCSGDKKSTLACTNLQNIAGLVEHPIVKPYNLPPVRSVITNAGMKDSLWLVDLSASHMQIAAKNSKDSTLVEILGYKDPHSLMTSKMFALNGQDFSREYCEENKKQALVAYMRGIAKVSTYTQFNDGKARTFLASLLKSFVNVSLEDCQLAQEALAEAFPGYTSYAQKCKSKAYSHIVEVAGQKYVRYRTHDGRLFHVEVWERINRNGDRYDGFKLGEITSSMLISPEALIMKKAGIKLLEFLRANRHLPIQLNSFTHD